MSWFSPVVVSLSCVLLAQAVFSLYLMLYSWEDAERLHASSAPRSYLAPRISFSVLLPARHEEAVMYETIRRVWTARYPSHLLEIVVICHADDRGTIAEAWRAAHDLGSRQIRVETFADLPINKPHGLNIGLRGTSNQVVTIFDAEDDIDPNIFSMVNTVMLKEGCGIVQAGVQLMNFRDHWFGIHNCLEYFFWFKSGLHLFSRLGIIPLGGNTVFFRRDLLTRVGGWDEACLTEDADIGLRLSVQGEAIRVIYDTRHVTREETPESTGSFIRQRTRWHQGFLQVLQKGTWRALPTLRQRLLAMLTFSYPLYQAAVFLILWPLTIIESLWIKENLLITMFSFFPLYALMLQCLATALGAFLFTKEYGQSYSLPRLLFLALTFLPYQILVGISAMRAVYRHVRKHNNWEKTTHLGAHRQPQATPSPGEKKRLAVITDKNALF